MSEYWKSTPKYWCKHCSIYVRDTKLERANHEATGKHQGAIKRSLRDLHRNHEQGEREKDRAKREVERLNGVVSGARPNNSFRAPGSSSAGGQASATDERQRQLEQLAGLGVNIPTELRPELALASEWTVTSTRVVRDLDQDPDGNDVAGRAAGVRKRERDQTEEDKEEEDAVKGLFKKPKKWGRDSRTVATEEDDELEQLLSGPLVKPKQEKDEHVKTEPVPEPEIKTEEASSAEGTTLAAKTDDAKDAPPLVKQESGEAAGGLTSDIPAIQEEEKKAGAAEPAVVFKKRKPKNVRQK